MMSGRVAVMMKESFGRVGEVRGGKKRRWAAGSGGGPLGTLLLLEPRLVLQWRFSCPYRPSWYPMPTCDLEAAGDQKR